MVIKDPTTGKYKMVDQSQPVLNTQKTINKPIGQAVTKDPTTGKYIFNGTPVQSSKPDLSTLGGLQALASKNDIKTPTETPQKSTLQKVLDVLNTGAYAVGGLMQGKGAIQGIKDKTFPSEALGIKNKIGAFAVDVLLDPTTYITFGTGAGAKLATKAGVVVLNKTGTSLLKKSILELGEEAGRKALAEKLVQEGAEKYVAKDGLKFMGTQVLPRKVVTAPFRAADKVVEATPIVGNLYKGAKDLAGKAFVPFKAIKELPQGGQYVDEYSKFIKGTRAESGQAINEAAQWGKTAQKELGREAGTDVAKLIETGGKSANPNIDDLVNTIKQSQQSITEAEKSRGLLKTELQDGGYLRHLLTPEARDFLDRGGKVSSELTKPLSVKTPFAKQRKLKGTIDEINKAFQKEHKINLFEPDAFKALAGRKVESIKAVNTYDFFKNVGQNFGVPAEIQKITSPITGKSIKTAKPLIQDGVKYVESSVPHLKGVLLPEPIVSHINETYKVLSSDEATKGFLKAYDKVLGFWKGSVTGWFPAFHSRNLMGGMFNNWIGGVKNPLRYLQGDQIAAGKAGKIITETGTTLTYDQIRNLADKLGVTGQPGMMDVMKEVETGINKSKIGLSEIPQKAMGWVENRIRIPLFVDRIIKGDAPEEAAKQVFKMQFDYAPEALTAFEKNVMKRLMPFYRWTRGNIPLQLEQIIKQPGKYAGLGKFVKSIGGQKQDEETQYLPQYMREGLPIRVGEKNGLPQYLYGLGLPVEDVNRLWRGSGLRTLQGFIGELSPILKYPIEAGTGQNLFYGEPIDKGDFVYPYVSKIPGLSEWMEVQERKSKDGKITYRANPYKLHFLNTVLGRFYTTAGKMTDENTSGAIKFLYGVAGLKARGVDMENEKYWQEKELKDKIENLLERKGALKTFEKAYIPKY